MRLGVHLVSFGFPGGPSSVAPTLAELGRAADEAGVDVLSCMDHWFQLPYLGGAELPMLEGYTTLGFLSAHSTSVELQLLVTGVTYRHPGLLAKIVTRVDVLSGGRSRLGLGAAWYEREHRGLGVTFPTARERLERVEETLQIVRQMWSTDDGPFEGRHYSLAETICEPQPLRRPPIMVGGQGERRTLRLVAAYADACNLFANPRDGAAAVAHKLSVLREHCATVGRAYEDIARTILWSPDLDPRASGANFVEQMRTFADVGVEEVHVMHFGGEPVRFVRELGTYVVPALRPV